MASKKKKMTKAQVKQQKKKIAHRLYYSVSLLLIISIYCLLNVNNNSFALWFETNNQPNDNLISTGCFKIDFNDKDKDGKSTSINLDNSYPISDDKGVKLKPYSFSIKNTCNIKGEYRIVLSKLNNSTLDDRYIRYTFNNVKDAIIVKELPLDSTTTLEEGVADVINGRNDPKYVVANYNLEEGVLKPGEEKKYELRLWINIDASNDQMNKEFEAVVSVSSIAIN